MMGSFPRLSRKWIFFLAIGLLSLGGAHEIIGFWHIGLAKENDELKERHDKLRARLEQLQADAITGQQISQTISAEEVNKLLAPAKREAMTAKLEALAAAFRLSNFAYNLSPPIPWDGGTSFPEIKHASSSTLSVEADAPYDSDIYAFLESIGTLQGRFEIQSLHISPLHEGKADNVSTINLHLKVAFQWIANSPDIDSKGTE